MFEKAVSFILGGVATIVIQAYLTTILNTVDAIKYEASWNCHTKYSAHGHIEGDKFIESGTLDEIRIIPGGCWLRVRNGKK